MTVPVAVVGAGSRGRGYAEWIAAHPDRARVVAVAEAADVVFAVGHVLRYTPYTRALKSIVDSGRLGRVTSVQHLEPVGFWHQAHSFVRGNGRREDMSTFMLMSKSCHDIDWLQHIVGQPIGRVSSFGSLSHSTPANRPAGAADRCLDCPPRVESNCAYSAVRFYGSRLRDGRHSWPLEPRGRRADHPGVRLPHRPHGNHRHHRGRGPGR